MPVYRFRILDKFNRAIAGQFIYCMDDESARRHADVLAAVSRRQNIEIRADRRLVARESPHLRHSIPRLCNCPRCSRPDVFVTHWPDVQCLTCGCEYAINRPIEMTH